MTDDRKRFTLRIENSLFEDIKYSASLNRRSTTDEILVAIEYYLSHIKNSDLKSI